MNPKVLIREEDLRRVASALASSFRQRANDYGIGEIDQEQSDRYATLVVHHTKPGGRVLGFGSGTWHILYPLLW